MGTDTAQPPQVAAAIVAAMAAVRGVGKNGHNGEQNFKYRKYDDILSVAHDALVEAGLAILPDVVEMKQRTVDVVTKHGHNRTVTTTVVKVKYTLIAASDASERSFTFYGEASDYGDKSLGKALSYAEKMMLIKVLKIPVDSDDLDPDQHSHADDEPVGRGERPRTQRPVREPKASNETRRRGAEAARAAIRTAQAPATPTPPAESDDALHADIVLRLTAFDEDPAAEGGRAALEKIWGDVERARLERNAWSVEDYNTVKAWVRTINERLTAAEQAAVADTMAQVHAHKANPAELDPWSEDPHEAAAARAAIDAAQGHTPMALIPTPETPAQRGNPDARA